MTLEGFLTNFGVLTEATGGVGHLRNLILELAAKGQLVSQQATDEPASILVKRIFEEHRIPPSGESLHSVAIPFAIPASWIWGTGALVFTFITSGSRGWAQHYSEEGPIFLRIGNLNYATTALDLSSIQRVSPPSDAEGSRTRVQTGDILISITGDTGMIGLVPSDLGEAYVNQHIALSRPSRNICPAYLAKILTAPFSLGRFQRAQRGIKNSLGLADIKKLLFPIPPLAEQERIVAKVDQLMALCDELEAQQTKKRETGTKLTQSALDALTSAEGIEEFAKAWQRVTDNFQILFQKHESMGELRKAILGLAVRGRLAPQHQDEEPAAILLERIRILSPKKTEGRHAKKQDVTRAANSAPAIFAPPPQWQWATFTEVASIESRLVNPLEHGDQPHIAPDTIEKSTGRLLSYRTIREDKVTSPKHQFQAGQLLYSKIRPNLSKAVIVDFDGLCSADMYPITSRINTRYLLLCMLSDVFLMQVVQGDNRLAMPKVNQQQLAATVLPIPPLAEQQRIVAKVDQLLALCDTLESKLRDAEHGAQRLAEAMVAEIVA
ncbi:restriction endonuclease subunit S [Corallococcus sp. CA041A]|uniref:restriction endonuclease subunit S n=1 Tax=Corallococcus sp. CA041A TaxID=2316727 RepID=UPI000EA13282|nr:restriction endonuclease subunit S [Corallococcus sp. CA041A]RKH23796.1 restriction endonuclease subunit S [Corallococcus sp. CA041A]